MESVDKLYDMYKRSYQDKSYKDQRDEFKPLISKIENSLDPNSKTKSLDVLGMIKNEVVDSLSKYNMPITNDNVYGLIKRELKAPSNPFIKAAVVVMDKYNPNTRSDIEYDYIR